MLDGVDSDSDGMDLREDPANWRGFSLFDVSC